MFILSLDKGWSAVLNTFSLISYLNSLNLEGNEHFDEEVSSLGLSFGNDFTIYSIFSVNDTKSSFNINIILTYDIFFLSFQPENVLLDDDLNVKLSDFGFACVLAEGEELTGKE